MVAFAAWGVFAYLYSVAGGLKAVAMTDIVQVTLLVLAVIASLATPARAAVNTIVTLDIDYSTSTGFRRARSA